MGSVEIIIMTESSKFAKKCVAGIDTSSGKWVRVVSNDEETHGAISDEYLICSNGRMCEVLDIVSVPIKQSCGNNIQPENVLMDTTRFIEYRGKATFEDVLKLHPAEIRENVLGNIYTYITEQRVETVGYSLTLIKVNRLIIHQVKTPEGKNKTKVSFMYRGDEYEMMSVTDPKFYSVSDATEYNDAFLVVSIGTPYNNKYYKFVSKIFVCI